MESQSTTAEQKMCRVTLEGPASRAPRRRLLFFCRSSRQEWRRLTLELHVGSESCPDWDHANLCLTAIQDLIKVSDGLMTDNVVKALRTHMEVVSYETFRSKSKS
jgi:hypothetical protein